MPCIQLLDRSEQRPLAGVSILLVTNGRWSPPAVTDANGSASFPDQEGTATLYVNGRVHFRGIIGPESVFYLGAGAGLTGDFGREPP